MAVTAAQVVVSSSAVALNPAEADTTSGSRLVIRNSHATDALVLGPSGVTPSTGFGLAAGGVIVVEVPSGEQIFAIRGAAADVTAHVLRLGA
jgi:hypothetical protein